MLHEWRSPARWLGSRNAWRPADAARRRAAILGAFVDRARIDWSAALRHARDPEERALVEGLHRLDSIRDVPPQDHAQRTADRRVWPLAVATALGLTQVICVLMLAGLTLASGAPAPPGGTVHLGLALAFFAASLLPGGAGAPLASVRPASIKTQIT